MITLQSMSKRFLTNGYLKCHMRTHICENPYPCNQCTKTFSLYSNLKKHLRIYTDMKSYPCDQCTIAFSEYSSMKKQVRNHILEINSISKVHCPRTTKSFNFLLQSNQIKSNLILLIKSQIKSNFIIDY